MLHVSRNVCVWGAYISRSSLEMRLQPFNLTKIYALHRNSERKARGLCTLIRYIVDEVRLTITPKQISYLQDIYPPLTQ